MRRIARCFLVLGLLLLFAVPVSAGVVGKIGVPRSAYDVAVSGNFAYVVEADFDQNEPGIPTLLIFDVSDPANPTLAGTYTDTSTLRLFGIDVVV